MVQVLVMILGSQSSALMFRGGSCWTMYYIASQVAAILVVSCVSIRLCVDRVVMLLSSVGWQMMCDRRRPPAGELRLGIWTRRGNTSDRGGFDHAKSTQSFPNSPDPSRKTQTLTAVL